MSLPAPYLPHDTGKTSEKRLQIAGMRRKANRAGPLRISRCLPRISAGLPQISGGLPRILSSKDFGLSSKDFGLSSKDFGWSSTDFGNWGAREPHRVPVFQRVDPIASRLASLADGRGRHSREIRVLPLQLTGATRPFQRKFELARHRRERLSGVATCIILELPRMMLKTL